MKHRYTPPTPVNRGDVIDVAVDALDIEDSNAPPPTVGSLTTWLLTFNPANTPDAVELPGHTVWTPELHAVRSGGITAYVAHTRDTRHDRDRRLSTGTFTGTMLGGSTPDDLPTTTGIVLELHVRHQIYRETRPHSLLPVPGSDTLRPVIRSPKWFDRETMVSGRDCGIESGLIITMAVPRQ
ncbi:hypothetical protein HQ325_16685 [Rhodococcus sp. BP-349]|uniref:hypothetical protein n=1 Tax=unclassified Rhodococcus (in: high G+C Gram-positive bacteria) TaxID=192944 RepID=UPI001C9A5FB2|nr:MULTISPECIES: hypothetical protein [unclassified Rhodococcus (in: high G+C Gram-positive bacteria)]MBY6540312.1 hypothetical protein [Rhodococcus sp. BP-363]MBY6545663.1 hypothetical protein [Rhodococcus sp. BP-369]MBY6564893.1 hypothetical protein [Rhodococcus sp. BP-370]MBY6578171.1 hypothetical protein [Rhodococcus sp. BP-364]MBY6587472.1 hypothetical protein [Rhodococcus sp. BP-358]